MEYQNKINLIKEKIKINLRKLNKIKIAPKFNKI